MIWPSSTLDNISDSIVDGPFGSSLKTSDYVDAGVPVLQGKNITGDSFVWKEVRFIPERKAQELKRSSVVPGDHLLIKIGSIGYSAVIEHLNGHDYAIIPANMARIRPNRRIIDDRYLHHWLKSEPTKRHFQSVASSTAQPALSLSKIREATLPLPPLDEQRRIAAILDKADALRRKCKRALALLDGLTQSIFSEMFRDTSHMIPLDEICLKITDGTHQAPNWTVTGVPFLFVSNIRNQAISFETNKFISEEEYNTLTRYSPIEEGDVLYTAVGSYGHAAVVPPNKKFIFQRHVAHLKPDRQKIVPDFLSVALESAPVKMQADRVARGVAQKTVTLGEMRKINIPLPNLRQQNEFTAVLSRLRWQAANHLRGASKEDCLFATLQHLAFSGQL